MPDIQHWIQGSDGIMNPAVSFRAPRSWRRVGKYLFPVGLDLGWRFTKPPREQVRIAKLAAEHPECVTLHFAGKAEIQPEFVYECHAFGKREMGVLPAKFAAPAFVAEIQNGLSYGRHCCVIGPAGKAVRETGFNLGGEVLSERVPISPLRLQYWRKRWEGDVTSRPWLPCKQRIDGRVAVLNTRFSHNFYHWMIDILPRLMPLRRIGVEADYYLIDCLSPFQQNVLAALGIEPDQLIQPHCRLLLEAEQLVVPSMPTPACLRDLGRALAAGLGVDRPVRFTRRIFISRRKTGTRTLTNEAELEKLLHSHHFETHFMEQYPLAKQARLIREADVIVATHGAGLANLLFARPGTHVIEIMPAGRYNDTCYPKKSRIFDLHHQLLFAERARHKQILSVSLDDVETALEQTQNNKQRLAVA
jgi:capsular polysaccharide biosynthesis protein